MSDLKFDFEKNGFAIVRGFLDPETAAAFRDAAANDPDMGGHSHGVKDASGRESRLVLWYKPGGDVFSRLSCSDRMHNEMAECLGEDVSFFHAKLMQKLPKVGGSWEWHQDYGYWYDDGFLTADMASCYVALDKATLENGCLQVVPKSHTYGRIDHGRKGQQAGAEQARIDTLSERHGVFPVELQPGDAVYFHANTLHMSGPNLSDHPRLGLISSFFTVSNQSILDDRRFQPKPYIRVAHDALLDVDPNAPPRSGFLDGEETLKKNALLAEV